MNKLECICYAFQCDMEKTFVKDGFLFIPFDDSFPDDWAFDDYEIDQRDLNGEKFWLVKLGKES